MLGAARRASHGPGDERLRLRLRARFRPTSCDGNARPSSLRSCRRCRLLRTRRGDGRMTAALEVTGLCAGYDRVQVLHDVALTLQPASITAVLGANGAGKTTLLRTISGLLQ